MATKTQPGHRGTSNSSAVEIGENVSNRTRNLFVSTRVTLEIITDLASARFKLFSEERNVTNRPLSFGLFLKIPNSKDVRARGEEFSHYFSYLSSTDFIKKNALTANKHNRAILYLNKILITPVSSLLPYFINSNSVNSSRDSLSLSLER